MCRVFWLLGHDTKKIVFVATGNYWQLSVTMSCICLIVYALYLHLHLHLYLCPEPERQCSACFHTLPLAMDISYPLSPTLHLPT